MSEQTKVKEEKPSPSISPPKSGSSSVWKFPLLSIIVVALSIVFFRNADDPKLLGSDIPLRTSFKDLSPVEQKRWSLDPASPLPPTKFPLYDFDFAEKAMANEKPLLIKGIPRWPAMSKWTPEYFQQHFPVMSVHVPSSPVVRLHQDDDTHPFGSIPGLNWTRPWLEQQVYSSVLYKADKLMYSMVNAKHMPNELLQDLDISRLSVAYSPPLEINMWMGTPTVTTPAHYDFVHNFYTQIYGKKRWIMFPPEDVFQLYIFTALHPSARQSQIDFNDENSFSLFPEFKNAHPIEVVLEPGDVLYIPPMWFHYVSAVGDTPSISISTHTDSQQAKIRERVMTKSEAYFKTLFQKQKYNKKNLALTVNIAAKYIVELFANSGEAKEFLGKLVASHWSHLEHDKDVVGLNEKVVESRNSFPSKEEIDKEALPNGIQANIASASRDIKQLLHQFNGGVRDILTMNHIEETASYLVGPLNVDPFLRYLANL